MSKENLIFGKSGENIAEEFLKKNGYKILLRNYKTKLGEIDIIASEKNTYCFIEVKTRHSDKFGLPMEAVSRVKQKQISRAALHFIKERRLFDEKARFDVVSVLYSQDFPRIELIRNAFDLAKEYTY